MSSNSFTVTVLMDQMLLPTNGEESQRTMASPWSSNVIEQTGKALVRGALDLQGTQKW